MKKILSASNSAEAYLVAEALRQDGISASVQGEWGSLETPSVWIGMRPIAQRAATLVTEMEARREPHPVQAPARGRTNGFVGGLVLGALIGAVIAATLGSNLVPGSHVWWNRIVHECTRWPSDGL